MCVARWRREGRNRQAGQGRCEEGAQAGRGRWQRDGLPLVRLRQRRREEASADGKGTKREGEREEGLWQEGRAEGGGTSQLDRGRRPGWSQKTARGTKKLVALAEPRDRAGTAGASREQLKAAQGVRATQVATLSPATDGGGMGQLR